jgi:hypothetical protein
VTIVVGREKRGTRVSIHTLSFLGGAMPVASSMPGTKGRMAHSLWLAPGTKQHPPLSRLIPGEHTHQAGGFSLALFSCDVTRASKPCGLDTGTFARRTSSTDQHRSAFTRGTDVPRNCLTLFCFQCTVYLFSHRRTKVERQQARVKTWRETRLTAGAGSPAACGGFSVKRPTSPALLL